MYRISLAVGLCLSLSTLAGQRYLYPAKVDHQWGIIDRKAKVIHPPSYDAFADERLYYESPPWIPLDKKTIPSPYRKVQKGDLLGIIDQKGKLIVPPKYDNIRVLSPTFFITKSAQGLILLDVKGDTLLQENYQRIVYLGSVNEQAYFAYLKGGAWGGLQLFPRQVTPPKYKRIKLLNNYPAYAIREEGAKGWGVVNIHGSPILSSSYYEVGALSDGLYFTQDKHEGKMTIREQGDIQLSLPTWDSIACLDNHLTSLYNGLRSSVIFSNIHRKILPTPASVAVRYSSLDDKYTLFKGPNICGLIDRDGNVKVTSQEYSSFQVFNDTLYQTRKLFGKGLWHEKKGELLPPIYQSIEFISDSLILVSKNDSFGIFDQDYNEILPTSYERIIYQNGIFKVTRQGITEVLKLNDGQIERQSQYANVRTLRIYKLPYQLAEEIKDTISNLPVEAEMISLPPRKLKKATWFWKKNSMTGLWSFPKHLSKKGASQRFDNPQLRDVYGLPLQRNYITYLNEPVFGSAIHPILKAEADGLHPIALFSEEKGDWQTDFNYLGIRYKDFYQQRRYAAAIHKDGSFRLLDAKGKEKLQQDGSPLRLSYIGEWINDRAIACVGGTLEPLDSFALIRFAIQPAEKLREDYRLRRPEGSRILNEYFWISPWEDNAGRWGIIDESGEWIIPPQYDAMRPPVENQVAVCKDGKWGVVDMSNSVVVPLQWQYVLPYFEYWRVIDKAQGKIYFNNYGHQVVGPNYDNHGPIVNNHCRVQQNSKWGLVNEAGELIIPCLYEEMTDCSEGLLCARQNNNWMLLDTSGQKYPFMPSQKIERVWPMKEGLIRFQTQQGYSFADQTGKAAIGEFYTAASDFDRGIARVRIQDRAGLIDREGNWVLEPSLLSDIYPFDKNGIAITKSPAGYGLLHITGQIVTTETFQSIMPFQEGLARCKMEGKYGFLNVKGEIAIPIIYEFAQDFSEGLAAVRSYKKRTWHYIHRDGSMAIAGPFYQASAFKNGKASVKRRPGYDDAQEQINIQGKTLQSAQKDVLFYDSDIVGRRLPYKRVAYTNKDGSIIFGKIFHEIEPFQDGFARVRKKGKLGIFSHKGLYLLRPKYALLERHPVNGFIAGIPALGLYDRNGKEILPPIYDQIRMFSGSMLRVEQGEKVGYFKVNGKEVWPLQN